AHEPDGQRVRGRSGKSQADVRGDAGRPLHEPGCGRALDAGREGPEERRGRDGQSRAVRGGLRGDGGGRALPEPGRRRDMGATAVTPGAVSRRTFMKATGRTGLGAAALAAGAGGLRPRPGAAQAGSIRTIELEARELTWELAPGRRVKGLAYNGRIP